MHGVYPSLIIMLRIPFTYDIVSILIELQVKSDGIVRTTAKAVVLRMIAPRVYNLLHQTSVDGEIKELGLTRFTRGVMWLMKEIFNLDTKFMPVEPLDEEGQYLLSQIMGDAFTFHNWWHHLWHYRWHNLA